MKCKRIIGVALLVTMLFSSIAIGYAKEITVTIDEKQIECPVPARIDNGRTMVPMRAIFEAFGMEVTWNNEERSVTATDGKDVIKLIVGDKKLQINDKIVEMDVAPYIADDTTLVPVRAVSESLDATVEWNNLERQVKITTAEAAKNKDEWKENLGTVDLTELKVTGDGASVDGNVVMITDGGDFTVTGENENAMIWVNTGEKVKLRLSGIKLTNMAGPAIYFENAGEALITISKGTENYVVDSEEYFVDAKAAIFAEDDIEIKGSGTLWVTSKAHHAIASDDDIKIEEGTLLLVAEKKDGIHANNTIKIKGGNINIVAYGDGIQAEEDVIIEDGEIGVTTNGEVAESNNGWGNRGGFDTGRGGRGWQTPPEGMMPPEGMEGMTPPERMMPPEGMEGMMPPEMNEEATEVNELTSTKGIKAETNVTISGGSIVVDSADHAIHSAATLNITGGKMTLSSKKGKGISAHGDVVVDNGEINIIKATEGLESKANLTINGGIIKITGSDDGVNAGGTGGRDVANRQDSSQETGHDLMINGGEIFVDAAGDGLDANGRMIISGGNIIVEGPTNNGNGSLDSGGVIRVDGGTIIALGASGMAEVPGNDSAQPVFRLVTESNILQGSNIVIKNAKGEEIYNYTTIKQGNSIVFSAPTLKVGETYSVTINDVVHTVEMTATITTVGNGGFGGFGGFGGRPR